MIQKNEWEVLGKIPLEEKIPLTFFGGNDAFANELYLKEYVVTQDNPLGLGSVFKKRPATQNEIVKLNASSDGLFGWKAAEIKLSMKLKQNGKY